jgi:serine/arginine repetitive matrix protein 2
MYNRIGLHTPRGTGTSGYVEQNLAAPKKKGSPERAAPAAHPRYVSKALEDFDTRRAVELKCYRLRKKLESENAGPDAIEAAVAQLRESLTPPPAPDPPQPPNRGPA